jgi:hypothetical protein
VRKRELRVVGRDILEEQYIDIQRAWAKPHSSAATLILLDALALTQELARRKS